MPRPADAAGGVVQGTLHSAAARPAAHAVAEQAQVSVASVVLAAYVRSVARMCGTDALLVQLMSANRFGGRWKDLVTSMNQWVPALIEAARNDDLVTAGRRRALEQPRGRPPRNARRHRRRGAARPHARGPRSGVRLQLRGRTGTVRRWTPYRAGSRRLRHPPVLTWEEPFTTIGPRCYARALESDDALTVRLTAKDLGQEQCAALLWTCTRAC